MNIVKSAILFVFMSLVPSLLLYLAFEGMLYQIIIFSFLGAWAMVYTYIDKLVLSVLKAREVVDTDHLTLFQCVKNECYKNKQPSPKVYLYSGNKLKSFVLQSRNEWTIVIDRKLIRGLRDEQIKSLVSYLFEYKKSGNGLLQTKAMGIISLLYTVHCWILKNIFFLKYDSRLYKVLTTINFSMLSPLLRPLDLLGSREMEIAGDENLRSIINQLDLESLDLNKLITYQLVSHTEPKRLLISYLESIPVLESCKFNETSI